MNLLRFEETVTLLGQPFKVSVAIGISAIDAPPDEAGVIRATPAPSGRVFEFEPGAMSPPASPTPPSAEASHRIALTDLDPELPSSQKFLLMLRHFLETPVGVGSFGRDILGALYQEYKRHLKLEGDVQKLDDIAQVVEAGGDPLAAEWQRVIEAAEANPDDLVKRDGSINASAVARAAGLPTGGSRWEDVKALCERVESLLAA